VCIIWIVGEDVMGKNKPTGTDQDQKLLAWLETNAPWLMHMDSTRVMARVGLNLKYGETIGRSVDDSLAAARAELRKEYQDGTGTESIDVPGGEARGDGSRNGSGGKAA
jgi:hypothetical protein